MSFVIWTFRRTGGTSLAQLLFDAAGGPRVGHEPFNIDREFGWVTRAFRENGDTAALAANIAQAMTDDPSIKHCHELVAPEMNAALLDHTLARGYRHLVLERDAEVERVLSLELARKTGVWGSREAKETYRRILEGEMQLGPIKLGEAVAQMRLCARRRAELAALFAARGVTPHVVRFEEVYGRGAEGEQRVDEIFAHLGLDRDALPDYAARRHEALYARGQGSGRILPLVPNIEEVRDALTREHAHLSGTG